MASISKLAIFSPSLAPGGAEGVMVNLAKGFLERGIDVDFVLGQASGALLGELPGEVNVVDLNAYSVSACFPGLVRYFRSTTSDALITTQMHANVVVLFAKRFSRTKLPVLIREATTPSEYVATTNDLKMKILSLLVRFVYPWADEIVAVSNGAKDDLSKMAHISKDDIRVLYNPVISEDLFEKGKCPIDTTLNGERETITILSVGRLAEEKDYPTLIRAFACIREKVHNARLVLLGEGPCRNELQDLVHELDLEDRVLMPGHKNNPYAYMSRATVYVLSSLFEGMPNSLIEALALGVPVVATDCNSGPREVLRDGKLGKLVPVGDYIAMSKAIVETLENVKNYRLVDESIEEFRYENSVQGYLSIIEKLVNQGCTKGP